MQYLRWTLLVWVLATGLALPGCSDPPDGFSAPEVPVDPPPVSEQVDTREPVDVVPDKQDKREPAPISEKETTHKPLDLSMPPQPVVAPDSGNNIDASRDRLLPDLFQQEPRPDDGRSGHLRGTVLMKEGEEQSLDSLEGGQLIFEKKNR